VRLLIILYLIDPTVINSTLVTRQGDTFLVQGTNFGPTTTPTKWQFKVQMQNQQTTVAVTCTMSNPSTLLSCVVPAILGTSPTDWVLKITVGSVTTSASLYPISMIAILF
jgi:hypothetical protein